jgi:cytochrome c-type biogenesis protein CcmH
VRPDAKPEALHRRPAPVSIGTALILLAGLGTPAGGRAGRLEAADLSPQQQIESQLMCYCGCTDLTVRVCTCGVADSIRREIAGRLAQGATGDQVVAAFVAERGEVIRSAPTKEGFNLVAWVAPFAALAIAGWALVVMVRRWQPRGAAPRAAGNRTPLTPAEKQALERVEREIREGY